MKPPRSAVRLHRILGSLAVLHAAVLSSWLLLAEHGYAIPRESWAMAQAMARFWVGFATLWLLWPVVLALHSGRSSLRFLIPLIVSLPLLLPSVREYRLFSAPVYMFGLPPGVYLSPWSIRDYITAYRAGRTDAQNDLRSGHLAIEVHSLPMKGEPEYSRILRERYQIEVRRIAGDTDVTERVLGHSKGYNEISKPEIKRKFGDDILNTAEEAAAKHYDESRAQ